MRIAFKSADEAGAFAAQWPQIMARYRGLTGLLGLSTALDLITAYFFTRPMVVLLGRNRIFTEARWLGVARGLGHQRGSGMSEQ